MPAAETGAAMPANGINLINEDDARCMLLGLLEHITHTGRTNTYKHLDEIRTGDSKERDLGFAGDGLGQECFAGTGRTHHQDTTRNFAAEFLELARVTQELNEFADFFLGLFHTGDIIERHLDLIFSHQPRTALAERKCTTAAATALHLAHKIDPDTEQ